jgi:hypothetical protein
MSADGSEADLYAGLDDSVVPPGLRAWADMLLLTMRERDRQVAALMHEVDTLSHRVALLEATNSPPDAAASAAARGECKEEEEERSDSLAS